MEISQRRNVCKGSKDNKQAETTNRFVTKDQPRDKMGFDLHTWKHCILEQEGNSFSTYSYRAGYRTFYLCTTNRPQTINSSSTLYNHSWNSPMIQAHYEKDLCKLDGIYTKITAILWDLARR